MIFLQFLHINYTINEKPSENGHMHIITLIINDILVIILKIY